MPSPDVFSERKSSSMMTIGKRNFMARGSPSGRDWKGADYAAIRRRWLPEIQIFGSVTPCCPWYLPPRSLYDVSQTSSDSKKITCATPSLA